MLEGQAIVADVDASRFRGEFLQCCAEIEGQLCVALDRIAELGDGKKRPYLFGQKFERVQKNVNMPGLWKHKEHVETVLRQLEEFVGLRGSLGHAIMVSAEIEGQKAVCWWPPDRQNWADRRIMTASEMDDTLKRLRTVTDKFLRQALAGMPSLAS